MEWIVEQDNVVTQVHHNVDKVVWSGKSAFQEILLAQNSLYGKFLILDGDFQSSTSDSFIYHESLVHPVMLAHPKPQRVAILGGGEGATLYEVLRHPSVYKVYNIDLDRVVVDVCRRLAPEFHHGAFDDPRVQLVFDDALRFLETTSEAFDVILSDLTEPHPDSPTHALLGPRFFQLLARRLAPGGVVGLQASRGDLGLLQGVEQICREANAVFSHLRLMMTYVPSFHCNWCFLSASQQHDPAGLSLEEIRTRLHERGLNNLAHYDVETHRRITSLPLYLRKAVRCWTEARQLV